MTTTTSPTAAVAISRPSLDSAVSTVHLDRARALLEATTRAGDGLSIAKAPDDFERKMRELVDSEDAFGSALAMRTTPTGVQKEVEAQIVRNTTSNNASMLITIPIVVFLAETQI